MGIRRFDGNYQTLGQLLHEWAAYDLNHTIQAEKAVMQPFIQGSGPWRSYFQDHEIRSSHDRPALVLAAIFRLHFHIY